MTFDGSSIDGYVRVQEADMLARPDPSTFQVLPWRTDEVVARMFCDIVTPDGAPFDGDPRTVLKRNLRRASELGYIFYVAPELEFFYFADAGPEPKVLDQGGYFDLTPLDVAQEYRRDDQRPGGDRASPSSTPTTRWRPASTRSSSGTPMPSRWPTTS
jgi:glutamine synthetase